MYELRKNNVYPLKDNNGRSLKAKIKYADKQNSKYVIIIGDDEINTRKAKIKNMDTGNEELIPLEINEILEFIKK